MLEMMRRHSKSWLIKVFLGLIIFVFIFYFGTLRGRNPANLMAEVGKAPITTSDYAKAYQRLYEAYRLELGERLDADMVKKLGLKKLALERVVEDAIIAHKAKEFGVGSVTAGDVETIITRDPRFLTNGSFDQQKFSDFLREKRLEPNEFVQGIVREILLRQVVAVLQSGVRVMPREIQDFDAMSRSKIMVDFVVAPFQEEFVRISPTDKDLEEYLSANGKNFRLPERFRLKYLAFMGKDYTAGIKITPDEARQHYERFKDRFKGSTTGKSAPSFEQVKGKVEADLREINGMYAAGDAAKKAYEEIYQRENFAAYAQGKKLPVQTTEVFPLDKLPAPFNKVGGFAGTLQSLRGGAASKVVSDDKGYYIVTVAERHEAALPTVASIRGELERLYKRDKAVTQSEARITAMLSQIKEGKSFDAAAKEAGLPLRDSGLLPIADGKIPLLGGSNALTEALFALSRTQPHTEKPIPTGLGFAALRLKERVMPPRTDKIPNEAAIRNSLYVVKSREIVASWLKNVKQQMREDGTLKYHRTEEEL